ncbi:PaaI family thioesterase [Rhodococcus sp. NPDC058505]|uniref:PaaI family thioesterase n=1 Tax=unclassified Rhodococcus (in: high G+C Gram-positive bacteria) TaxID=192944 RepID=UPI0036597CB6
MSEPTTAQAASTFTMADALDGRSLAEAATFLNRGFAESIGLEFTEVSADRVNAHWEVGPHLFQPAGIVNGGVHCTVIETLASIGGSVWFGDRGHVVGVNNNTDFLRATRSGILTATATPIHRGRTQQLWQVQIVDAADRLVARGQVRLANVEDTARLGDS